MKNSYLCLIPGHGVRVENEPDMAEKSRYNFRVEPQDVDFTLRATIPSLGSAILNTAGADAHGKGYAMEAAVARM